MQIPLPQLEPRLQKRYQKLVKQHLQPIARSAPAGKALPDLQQAFASTQAAWRFYANERITLPALQQPLLQSARQQVDSFCQDYALVVHDFSDLRYSAHTRKTDRRCIGSDWGYTLASSLLLDDQQGQPRVPVSLSLRSADGWLSALAQPPANDCAPLDVLTQTMHLIDAQAWQRPAVHIIDRGGDSIFHYRQWQAAGYQFLVRADERQRVMWQKQELLLGEVLPQVELRPSTVVEISAQVEAQLLVGESTIVIKRPAYRRNRKGKRVWLKGEALSLRLVVCEVRLPDEGVMGRWCLLSNVGEDVPAWVLAQWYYWRWRIESYFKLLKSQGYEVEYWQQESGQSIGKRLLVVAMSCVVVWQLQGSAEPEAEHLRQRLIGMSGRQVRRGSSPAGALLAGMWVLMSAVELLAHQSVEELRDLARQVLPGYS